MPTPQSLRERLYIMVFQTDTVAGRRFDKILLLIIWPAWSPSSSTASTKCIRAMPACWPASSGALPLSSGRVPHPPVLLAQTAALCLQLLWLVDLLAILPGIIALYYSDAQYLLIIRVIRMLRIFRVLKLSPYLKQAHYLMEALRGSKQKIIVFW